MRRILVFITIFSFLLGVFPPFKANAQATFEGKYYSGKGDVGYLKLLENAYRMIRPDAEIENLSMLYHLDWNGFVEGPTWNMWWIQNSFGPTYTMLPFMDKVFRTFVANFQDLWQPKEAINCVYDCWGVPGGFLRGLFEYEYKADGIIIYPHIPPTIKQLQQKIPVYFGDKKIYISTSGSGSISSVYVNGKKTSNFNPDSFYLKMELPGEVVNLSIGLGGEPAQTDTRKYTGYL